MQHSLRQIGTVQRVSIVSKWPLTLAEQVRQGLVQYIDFPEALKGKYQSFTQADLSGLRRAGCDLPFVDVATGVARYVEWLAGAGATP